MCVVIGLISLISGYIRTALSNILAQKQGRTIREILFRSILSKDTVYFDQHKTGELSLYLTENVNKIQDGIGEKLGSAIEMVATCIGGIVIGEIDFLSSVII
jgi:ABC-type multidrug transport system fused ATPase/permease subunit